MIALFAFSVTLLAAVMISKMAERSVLSTSVLFLLSGFLLGESMLGVLHVNPTGDLESEIFSLALFSTLFSDGMQAGIHELAARWRLAFRALAIGLPLTMAGSALLAHELSGLPWHSALLLGVLLGPTDPVFAAAIVGRKEVSERLRQFLNLESGLNDGLSLPVVLFLLTTHRGDSPASLLWPVVLGIVLGAVLTLVVHRVEGMALFGSAESYRSLAAFGLALLVFSSARLLHANEFLAAFSAGITVISVRPGISVAFRSFSESVADVFKFAGIFTFGALLSPALMERLSLGDLALVTLSIVLVRPVALSVALIGSGLPWRERLAAAWFGPKGFASVLFGVMVLRSGTAGAERIFDLAAAVTASSIVAHSSTDVVLASWLQRGRKGARAAAGAP